MMCLLISRQRAIEWLWDSGFRPRPNAYVADERRRATVLALFEHQRTRVADGPSGARAARRAALAPTHQRARGGGNDHLSLPGSVNFWSSVATCRASARLTVTVFGRLHEDGKL